MKWIELRPGSYKLVDDSDERPAVNLPSKPGAPMVKMAPPWSQTEQQISSGDPRSQELAADVFDAERKKWASDGKWKQWESSRKAEWARNKPAWKKQKVAEEKAQLEKIVDQASKEAAKEVGL